MEDYKKEIRNVITDYDKLTESVTLAANVLGTDTDKIFDLIEYYFPINSLSEFNFILNNNTVSYIVKNFVQRYDFYCELQEKIKNGELKNITDKYQKNRTFNTRCICYSPWTTLNFENDGSVKTCCWLFGNIGYIRIDKKDTIKEIWNGDRIKKLRMSLLEEEFWKNPPPECLNCVSRLLKGNSAGMELYDRIFDKSILDLIPNNELTYPIKMEFNLSNECNLECIMCGSKFSSKIRENREGKPPLIKVYDKNFTEQLKEFYPHLKIVKFIGGEPFVNSLYHTMLDDMWEINPKIKIWITTNGTILNDRIKNILRKNSNISLSVSVDAFTPTTYEFIRKNAKFDTTMNNVKYFIENKHLSSISVAPMIQNWKEIPMILKFCDEHNIECFFNVVTGPMGGRIKGIHENGDIENNGTNKNNTIIPEICLDKLPPDYINKIADYYSQFNFNNKIIQSNLNSLIHELRGYIK